MLHSATVRRGKGVAGLLWQRQQVEGGWDRMDALE